MNRAAHAAASGSSPLAALTIASARTLAMSPRHQLDPCPPVIRFAHLEALVTYHGRQVRGHRFGVQVVEALGLIDVTLD